MEKQVIVAVCAGLGALVGAALGDLLDLPGALLAGLGAGLAVIVASLIIARKGPS